jgi:ribonucleoside-diphosphate reductase alpha chain
VTDEFMRAVLDDGDWDHARGAPPAAGRTYKARDLMRQIAEATHICGDPGMQYDTTVNDWHTCAEHGAHQRVNPCSEYMFLDDSACNLASINLMKFVREDDGEFDVEAFKRRVRTMITAQEILVDNSSYPTRGDRRNSHDYRPLGLGYANLGALLMSAACPTTPMRGRAYAAAVTALMHGEAYAQSAKHRARPRRAVRRLRPEPRAVPARHAQAPRRGAQGHRPYLVPADLLDAARRLWDEVIELGEAHGFRNAQATVLAPTGTIGFMMDCDTTGIEPDIALVKYKKLVGGG